ncbi:hypothetical protein EDB81DRAFT_633863 [Dactylonectria macrodidyma]|uniref:Uncharacterized protein n=1 Tax=Dactylonectria macrodidyma TaxID=307937 RepID=A0A9P9JJ06_9HYPO|nr:hypothetical protein EDB81DRAFT_633863 [Dactylonectria macrodidyma]
MGDLTAGYVAGIIAFAIAVAQLWCPTALTFILAGQLRDRETAATWTVAGRFLQSSFWPTILQADSAKSRGVRNSVFWTTLSIPSIAIIIAVAGVVTPLGLYERDEIDKDPISATFQYSADSSAFYAGTSRRRGLPFTRTCTYPWTCYAPCPYTADIEVVVDDGLSQNCSSMYGTNTTVPNVLHDIYNSGTKNRKTTVSNYFDIEWRQLTTQYDRELNNGTPYASGTFRFLQSLALEDTILPIEGLVVDGKKGRIGLRNHTLPVGHASGVMWSEDLLFLEPDVECVDTNTTIDFSISVGRVADYSSAINLSNLTITDHGGFVNINKTDPSDDQRNGVNQPDLKTRAYQAAWILNKYSMLLMNLTDPTDESNGTTLFSRIDSELDEGFRIHNPQRLSTDYKALGLIDTFSEHLIDDSAADDDDQIYSNPHGISIAKFDTARQVCQGTASDAAIKLNNTYVACNIIRGIPQRLDTGAGAVFEDGSKWSSPLYTCASAVRATIKKVTFFYNGTEGSLDNLVIKEIEDKKYENEDEMPLWGVEDWFYKLDQMHPIWGLLDPAFEGFQNISTIRAPSLYMVGSGEGFGEVLGTQSPAMNLPGSIVPTGAMHTISAFSSAMDASAVPFDFTAQNSLSLWIKWKELSRSEDTVSKIIKLLWTDLASSAIVGTKGVLGHGNNEPDNAVPIQLFPMVHKVKYHWTFGIPAFLVLFCMAIILILAVVYAVMGQSNIDILGQRLKQVAAGRLLTTVFHPESSNFTMSAKHWSKANAGKQMVMTGGYAKHVDEGDSPFVGETTSNNSQSQEYIQLAPQGQEFHVR